MKKKTGRRLASILMLFALIIQLLPVYGVDAETDSYFDDAIAYAKLGSTLETQNMSVGSVDGYPFTVVERAGKEGYLMKTDWKTLWLMCDVSKNVINGNPERKNYDVEVEYYDEGKGRMVLAYPVMKNGKVVNEETEAVYMEDDLCWKKATFTMQNPCFSAHMQGKQGVDFELSARSEYYGFSKGSIIVSSVKLIERTDKNNVEIDITSPNFANHFFTGDDLDFDISINNITKEIFEADVLIEAVDEFLNVPLTKTEKITLKPGENKFKFKEEYEHYGYQYLFVTVTNGDKVYSQKRTNFSYSYSSNGEFINDKFGYSCHWAASRYSDAIDGGIEVAHKAGVGWMRDEYSWASTEKEKGKYQVSDAFTKYVDKMEEQDIKLLFILSFGNALYDGLNSVPYTEEGLKGWADYCAFMARTLKDKAEFFEVWNEYNLALFNDNAEVADNKHYYTLLKTTYDAVKSVAPELPLCGFATAGLSTGLMTETFEQGGAECIEGASYHLYHSGIDPTKTTYFRDHSTVRDVCDNYKPELKTFLTETGYSATDVDRYLHARYDVTAFVLSQENNTLDHFFIYDYICDGNNGDDKENNFGVLEAKSQTYRVPFSARPAFISISAMNNILGTPDYVEKISAQDNTAFAYHFKRTQDNKDVTVLWSNEASAYLAVDFGKENLEVRDMYGNIISPYNKNGVYSFNLSSDPVYVIGEYGSIKEASPDIDISDVSLKAPIGEDVVITIYKHIPDNMNVELILGEYSLSRLTNTPEFKGDKAEIKIHLDAQKLGKKEKMRLKLYNDKTVFYSGDIYVEYVEAVEVVGLTRYYSQNDLTRWILDLEIKSNYYTSKPEGTLKILSPDNFSRLIKPRKIPVLKPKETRKISLNLPKISSLTSYHFEADLMLNNGDTVKVNFPIDVAVGVYAKNKPKIDGVIEPGEYNKDTALVSNRYDQVVELINTGSWKGVNDQSAKSYVMWDEEYMYFACEVIDDVFSQPYSGSSIWKGDCIQLGLSYASRNGNPKSKSYTELGIAKTDDGKLEIMNWSVESGTDPSTKDTVCAIERVGNKTYYEARFPWKQIAPKGAEIKAGSQLGFSMIVNECDGGKRMGWIEFGAGVGDSKDPDDFANIYFVSLTN